jgi:hypothetical protein
MRYLMTHLVPALLPACAADSLATSTQAVEEYSKPETRYEQLRCDDPQLEHGLPPPEVPSEMCLYCYQP